MAGKPGMVLALKSVVTATDAAALTAGHDRVYAALDRLIDAGRRDGLIRADASSEDLADGLSGVTLANSRPGTQERANRVIVLLVDGLRHNAGPRR
ncbi:hypothetical protein GCM10022419_040730 [Nonomuraea rosea]|uniref:Transcriptional regulator SbtR-like C-terminal domain-containing protein n=1 Tax=Nonomuraea rosea TaxID=638574 RepID=A0ABP6WST3_9ACTN